jgi:hypothetical protein
LPAPWLHGTVSMSLPMFSPVNSLGKTLGRRERPPRRCLRAKPADGQVDHESGRFRWLAGGGGRPVNRCCCGHDDVSDSLGLGNQDHVRAWAPVIVAPARSAMERITSVPRACRRSQSQPTKASLSTSADPTAVGKAEELTSVTDLARDRCSWWSPSHPPRWPQAAVQGADGPDVSVVLLAPQ